MGESVGTLVVGANVGLVVGWLVGDFVGGGPLPVGFLVVGVRVLGEKLGVRVGDCCVTVGDPVTVQWQKWFALHARSQGMPLHINQRRHPPVPLFRTQCVPIQTAAG